MNEEFVDTMFGIEEDVNDDLFGIIEAKATCETSRCCCCCCCCWTTVVVVFTGACCWSTIRFVLIPLVGGGGGYRGNILNVVTKKEWM